HWMRGIALNLHGPAVFYCYENSTGIGTIVRANNMDYLLHDFHYMTSISEKPANDTTKSRRPTMLGRDRANHRIGPGLQRIQVELAGAQVRQGLHAEKLVFARFP